MCQSLMYLLQRKIQPWKKEDEIAELRVQGITVDDDNKPDELNATDLGPPPIRIWGKLAAC